MSKTDRLKKEYKLEDWSDSDIIEGKAQIPVINKEISLKYDSKRPELQNEINSIRDDSEDLERIQNTVESLLADFQEISQPNKDNIINLTIRYYAQMKLVGEVPEEAEVLFQELHEFIEELYKYHIPVYNFAFAEFDEMWKVRLSLQEVYIGRDGIYAYIGRLAQWEKTKEHGNIVWPKPKYLVYPRIFINGLTKKEKQEYFNANELSRNQDIVLFDICFNGTVPENILRNLGFPEEEIDERIFLLSAKNPARQFKTIPNDLGESIADLQYSPKIEKRALGVRINEQDQKIEYIAEPTNPKDQFFYLVMEVLIRDYYSSK